MFASMRLSPFWGRFVKVLLAVLFLLFVATGAVLRFEDQEKAALDYLYRTFSVADTLVIPQAAEDYRPDAIQVEFSTCTVSKLTRPKPKDVQVSKTSTDGFGIIFGEAQNGALVRCGHLVLPSGQVFMDWPVGDVLKLEGRTFVIGADCVAEWSTDGQMTEVLRLKKGRFGHPAIRLASGLIVGRYLEVERAEASFAGLLEFDGKEWKFHGCTDANWCLQKVSVSKDVLTLTMSQGQCCQPPMPPALVLAFNPNLGSFAKVEATVGTLAGM